MTGKRFEWAEIRRRAEEARAAIERISTPADDDARQILKERAKALAKTPPAAETTDGIDVLDFAIAQEMYAIETAFIEQVYPLTDLTPLPGTPRFVLGIVNLRSETVSVIDIRKFFDLPERGLSDRDHLIVLRDGEMSFAILADAILGSRRIPLSGIEPPLPTLTGIREKYLRGVTPDRRAVLDARKLINDEELIVRYGETERR